MKNYIFFTGIAAVFVLHLSIPAFAHPPYEREIHVFEANTGQDIHLVKFYRDGIFSVDPVQLIVRDENGHLLDETEFGRDILVLCWKSTNCIIFRYPYQDVMRILPIDVFRLDGFKLVHINSFWLASLGVLISLRDHWFGYLIQVSLFFVPIWLFKRVYRRPSTKKIFLVVIGSISMLFLLLWLYIVFALSRLSLPLLVALIICSVVGWAKCHPRGIWYEPK